MPCFKWLGLSIAFFTQELHYLKIRFDLVDTSELTQKSNQVHESIQNLILCDLDYGHESYGVGQCTM